MPKLETILLYALYVSLVGCGVYVAATEGEWVLVAVYAAVGVLTPVAAYFFDKKL